MSKQSTQSRPKLDPVSIATALYVLTLIGFSVAFQIPSGRIWGFNFGAFAPETYTWAIAGLGLAAGTAVIIFDRRKTDWTESDAPLPYWPTAVIFGTVVMLAFVLLRTQTHFSGDGYQLLSSIQSGSVAPKAWDRGTLNLLMALSSLFGEGSSSNALLAYRVYSFLAGMCFVTLSIVLSRRIIEDALGQLVLLVGLLSGGYLLHFFGHVENYAWLVAAVAATGLVGLAAMKDAINKWWIVLPVVVGSASHIFGLVLLPAALLVLVKDTSWSRKMNNLPGRIWLLVVIALIAVGVIAVEIVTDAWLFVRFSLLPIGIDRFTVDGYTLFSASHLADLINLLFLLCPGALVWLVGSLAREKADQTERASVVFLGALSLPTFMLGFLVEPKLGMPRDWDLLTFALVPICLCLYWNMARKTRRYPRLAIVGFLAALLAWLMIPPQLAARNDQDRAVEQFEYYLNLDFMRSRNAYRILHDFYANQGDSARGLSYIARSDTLYPERVFANYGLRLMQQQDYRSALLQFQRALSRDPLFSDAYTGVGYSYSHLGILDSSIAYLTIAEAMNPYNPHIQSGLGSALVGIQKYDLAEDHLLLAVRLDTTYYSPYANLAYIYGIRRDSANAAKYLQALVRHTKSPAERFYALANLYRSAGLTTLAAQAAAEAARRETTVQPQDSIPGLEPNSSVQGLEQ